MSVHTYIHMVLCAFTQTYTNTERKKVSCVFVHHNEEQFKLWHKKHVTNLHAVKNPSAFLHATSSEESSDGRVLADRFCKTCGTVKGLQQNIITHMKR